MSGLIELTPAADELAKLVRGVADAQLTDPTPCPAFTVADLLDHVGGLSFAFTAAASKQSLPPEQSAPVPDGSRLGSDWRDAIPGRWSPSLGPGPTRPPSRG